LSQPTTSETPLAPLLRRLERLAALEAADQAAILALPYNVKRCPAGSHLIRDGDRPEHCTLLLSGFAHRYKITGQGARQIIALHLPGEFTDFQTAFLPLSDHSVQTLTDADVAIIPRQALRELALGRSAAATALWVASLLDASVFREWVVNVGRRDSRARVAHLLCELSLRLGAAGLAQGHSYELPLTQEQLADAVGLTSVHVNRVLRQLAEEGLIARNRRWISIADWKRMTDAGDFSERYLHTALLTGDVRAA
jgi:CRP-like cAMP-binding protein